MIPIIIPEPFRVTCCLIVCFLSVLLLVASFDKRSWFSSLDERWLAASISFVILVNAGLALLSLMPMASPLRTLVVPLHAVILLFGVFALGPRAVWAALADTARAAKSAIRSFGPFLIVVFALFSLLLLIYAMAGFFTVPSSADELAYHVPQAVGAYQEGRIHTFAMPPTWILNYPQGAANVWAWTMFFTRSDALFHTVQMGFALQLLLAVWVLARRSGADPKSALLGVLTIAAMPIFYRLVMICGADIGFSAAVVAGIAFLAPAGENAKGSRQDLAAAALAVSQAFLIKIPIVAIIFLVVGLVYFILARVGRGERIAFLRQTARMPATWMLAGTFMFSSWTYLYNFFTTGNPLYPLTLKIAGHELFHGPLTAVDDFVSAHSTFGDLAAMSVIQRWHAAFADWFQPIDENAFGGSGPLFLTAVWLVSILVMLEGFRKRSPWIIALSVLVLLMFLVPATYLPRYALAWLCVLAVLASLGYTALAPIFPSLPVVVAGILLATVVSPLKDISGTLRWMAANADPAPWYLDRGRSIAERHDISPCFSPVPTMVKGIRDNVGSGDLLISSVWIKSQWHHPFAALMWNRDYSNIISYLHYDSTADAAWNTWRAAIALRNPQWILVGSNSGLVELLQKEQPASYKVFQADPPSGQDNLKACEMTLLKRNN